MKATIRRGLSGHGPAKLICACFRSLITQQHLMCGNRSASLFGTESIRNFIKRKHTQGGFL